MQLAGLTGAVLVGDFPALDSGNARGAVQGHASGSGTPLHCGSTTKSAPLWHQVHQPASRARPRQIHRTALPNGRGNVRTGNPAKRILPVTSISVPSTVQIGKEQSTALRARTPRVVRPAGPSLSIAPSRTQTRRSLVEPQTRNARNTAAHQRNSYEPQALRN